MRVLLDTHAFLWAGLDEKKLSVAAQTAFTDPTSDPLLSVVSLWEIAIKVGTGKLNLGQSFDRFVAHVLAATGMSLLPIELPHLSRLTNLPHHHRDPFDRLLVAQALAEGVPLLSADAELDAYGVQRVW